MPPAHVDVPALPILLPLGAVLMAASWARLRRVGMLSAWRLGAAWLAGWYVVAVLGATMLPLHLAWGAPAGQQELDQIILVPLTTMRMNDFLLNVVMTIPLATLLHVLAGIRDKARIVLIGFLLSLVIEITQAVLVLALHGNRWPDVNDLIANTLGALLGCLAMRRLLRFPRFRRAVDRASFVRAGSADRPAIR